MWRLQAEQTSQKRSWQLLLLLPKRGPQAFSSFCSALRETDQKHLCELLLQTTEENGKRTHEVSHTCLNTDMLKNTRLWADLTPMNEPEGELGLAILPDYYD